MFALEFSHSFAELSDRYSFQDVYDRFAHLLHDITDAASGFIGAGAPFIKPFTNATHRGERAFDVTNDLSQGDFVWLATQPLTARNASLAFYDAHGLQIVKNLLQEPLGDVLKLGDRLNWHYRFALIQAEYGRKQIRNVQMNATTNAKQPEEPWVQIVHQHSNLNP